MKSSPKIMELIQERLDKGKKEYKKELPINDGRDWLEEALLELLDAIVYLANKILLIRENKKFLRNVNSKLEYVLLQELIDKVEKDAELPQKKT